MPSLRKISFDLKRISREIKKGYGLYFPEDLLEFLQAVDEAVGLTPQSQRKIKNVRSLSDFEMGVYETVNGDKIWADTNDVVQMDFGQGEYDEYRMVVDPAHGPKFKAELGDDKLWDFFGIDR